MKKIGKIISALALGVVFTTAISGCSVYHDYSDALPYNNVYEKIKLGELTDLLEEQKNNSEKNEIIYVMYSTNEVTSSSTAVVTIDEQAKQYNVGKVYYLDAEKYYQDDEGKTEIKESLGVRDASVCPAILMFVDGEIEIDWTKTSVQNKYGESLTRVAYEMFVARPKTLNE